MLLASYQIPFITILILIFIVIFTYRLRKTSADQDQVLQKFWDREREANSTLRKDISNLDYINIPDDLFPLNLGTDTEKALANLCHKQMLNLSGKTNTDLKLEYGVMNFEKLSEYDTNFLEFVSLVPTYADELIAAGQVDDARKILEFAESHNADSKLITAKLSKL